MFIYRDKIENSVSPDSFGPYIEAIKLVLAASSFKIEASIYSANALYYNFGKYDKPFENETQYNEVSDLHDENFEILKTLGTSRSWELKSRPAM